MTVIFALTPTPLVSIATLLYFDIIYIIEERDGEREKSIHAEYASIICFFLQHQIECRIFNVNLIKIHDIQNKQKNLHSKGRQKYLSTHIQCYSKEKQRKKAKFYPNRKNRNKQLRFFLFCFENILHSHPYPYPLILIKKKARKFNIRVESKAEHKTEKILFFIVWQKSIWMSSVYSSRDCLYIYLYS